MEDKAQVQTKRRIDPKLVVVYRGQVVKDRANCHSRVIEDLEGGGLKEVCFDREYKGMKNAAICDNLNDVALVVIKVVSNPRNKMKKELHLDGNYHLPAMNENMLRELMTRRRRLMEADKVPDWAYFGPAGEEVFV